MGVDCVWGSVGVWIGWSGGSFGFGFGFGCSGWVYFWGWGVEVEVIYYLVDWLIVVVCIVVVGQCWVFFEYQVVVVVIDLVDQLGIYV